MGGNDTSGGEAAQSPGRDPALRELQRERRERAAQGGPHELRGPTNRREVPSDRGHPRGGVRVWHVIQEGVPVRWGWALSRPAVRDLRRGDGGYLQDKVRLDGGRGDCLGRVPDEYGHLSRSALHTRRGGLRRPGGDVHAALGWGALRRALTPG